MITNKKLNLELRAIDEAMNYPALSGEGLAHLNGMRRVLAWARSGGYGSVIGAACSLASWSSNDCSEMRVRDARGARHFRLHG